MTEITATYLVPTFLAGLLSAILLLSLRLVIFRYVEQHYLKKHQHITHREVKSIGFVKYWYSDDFRYFTKVKILIRNLDMVMPVAVLLVLGLEINYILIGILVHYTIINIMVILLSRYLQVDHFRGLVLERLFEIVIVLITTGFIFFIGESV